MQSKEVSTPLRVSQGLYMAPVCWVWHLQLARSFKDDLDLGLLLLLPK